MGIRTTTAFADVPSFGLGMRLAGGGVDKAHNTASWMTSEGTPGMHAAGQG